MKFVINTIKSRVIRDHIKILQPHHNKVRLFIFEKINDLTQIIFFFDTIEPDIKIEQSIEDYFSYKNVVLNKAIEILNKIEASSTPFKGFILRKHIIYLLINSKNVLKPRINQ
ncbi:hypothetical protein [Tenacibaculum sp. SDUM215027]|uniref:hypothetical protein n=1 Tax=Tenacibaculum sp. SDUM215027 TaxID=3422596 RepID=UPI003D31A744